MPDFDKTLSSVDCGNELCDVTYMMESTCIVYIPSENTSLPCNVPCDIEHCVQKVYHFTECPLWSCIPKTTTSSPNTTTLSPSSTTVAPSPSACQGALCISSVSFNVLILILLIGFGSFFLRKKIRQRQLRASYSGFSNPLSNPDHAPSAPRPTHDDAPSLAQGQFMDVPIQDRPDPPTPSPPHEAFPLRCFDAVRNLMKRANRESPVDNSTV